MEGCRPPRREGQDDGPEKILLSEICSPGAYVCHWNGDLLRVTDGPVFDQPEAKEMEAPAGGEPRYVTQISPDPFIPLSRARMIAANMDLEITC
jgi:hypothetical protein